MGTVWKSRRAPRRRGSVSRQSSAQRSVSRDTAVSPVSPGDTWCITVVNAPSLRLGRVLRSRCMQRPRLLWRMGAGGLACPRSVAGAMSGTGAPGSGAGSRTGVSAAASAQSSYARVDPKLAAQVAAFARAQQASPAQRNTADNDGKTSTAGDKGRGQSQFTTTPGGTSTWHDGDRGSQSALRAACVVLRGMCDVQCARARAQHSAAVGAVWVLCACEALHCTCNASALPHATLV